MIDSRVLVKGGAAIVIVLALILPVTDAIARDIRWLREEQGNAGREQSRGQQEQWQQPRQQSGATPERRPEQRMSPEERRQLRRDIRDAGREIYPRR